VMGAWNVWNGMKHAWPWVNGNRKIERGREGEEKK